MNCEDCKALISPFMENDLEESRAEFVRVHLAECGGCARVWEGIAAIMDVVAVEGEDLLAEHHSKQIWCRINNVIEGEQSPVNQQIVPESSKKGLWHLSFWQLASGLACIAIVSSLVTVAAIRNYYEPAAT